LVFCLQFPSFGKRSYVKHDHMARFYWPHTSSSALLLEDNIYRAFWFTSWSFNGFSFK